MGIGKVRIVLGYWLIGSMAVAMPLVAPSAEEGGRDGENRVSNVFQDTDLRQALEDVAAQAGVNIIAAPNVGGLVTVELVDVSVDRALQLLLAGTGFQATRADGYYLVFRPDEASDLFPSVATTRLVRIHHMRAESAKNLLPNSLQRFVRADNDSNAVVITAPKAQLDRILRDLSQIDTPTVASTHLIALDHSKATTARNLLPEALHRFVRADDTGNILAVTAPDQTLATILDHLEKIDVPRLPGPHSRPVLERTQVVKLSHTTAKSAWNLLPESVRNHVRADEEANLLAISLPEGLMKEVLEDLSRIDSPRRHVMLDARVVVLERGDLLDFGVNWSWPDIMAGRFTNDATRDSPPSGSRSPWELRIGYTPGRQFTNALMMRLNLLTQNNEATIVASPKVLAQDGKEAEISVTTEEWFQIISETGLYARAQLQEIETGTMLIITPRVGAQNQLTLDMKVEVSNVIARGESNLPVVNRRTARSTVQLESGGTAAVAGLVDSRLQSGRTGVPGLSNLPLLGRLFKTDSLNNQARQVAVFVTATLVDQDHGYFGTGRQREPMSRVDEAQFRKELAEALDRIMAMAEGTP